MFCSLKSVTVKDEGALELQLWVGQHANTTDPESEIGETHCVRVSRSVILAAKEKTMNR